MPAAREVILSEFRKRGMVSGGCLYVRPDVALECLDRCAELSFAVLGLEGFILRGEQIEPRMELIADWSLVPVETWEGFVERCDSLSRKYIADLPKDEDLVLHLAVTSQSENAEFEKRAEESWNKLLEEDPSLETARAQLGLDKASVRVVARRRRDDREEAEELHGRGEGSDSPETSDR